MNTFLKTYTLKCTGKNVASSKYCSPDYSKPHFGRPFVIFLQQNAAVGMLALLLRMPEVSISILGPEPGCNKTCRYSPQCFQANAGVLVKINDHFLLQSYKFIIG